MAEGLGLRRGQVVKRIVQREMAGEPVVPAVGPAAPEERKSSAVPALGNRASCGDVGVAADGDALGSGGDPVTGPAAASSRPVGSAGSAGSRPPAGVGAPSVSPSAGGEPAGVRLLDAAADALCAQGLSSARAVLVARRAILDGKVVVDGDVCRDPERLVDPGDLA